MSRPAAPLAELAAELADQQRRLNLLAAGDDPRGAVAAVFSWSIRHLPPPAAHAFAALGLHPGPDFDGYAAAALTGTGLAEARRTLEVLARAHLVHPTRGDRYGLHDLLRAYAASLVAEWADGDRQAAACRLFDYYLAAAATAVRTMYPAGAHREPAVAPAVFPLPCLTDTNTARAWLDTELGTLAATVAHTAAGGWPGHTVRFSTILFPYLDAGHHIHALAIHGHARKAARRLGDRVSAARAMLGLGCAQYRLGSYQVAAVHFRRALTLFQRAGDRIGEADALNDLGFLEERRGRYAAAADRHERALALYRQLADGAGQSRALNSLGIVDHRRGAYASAASHHRTALTLARRTGDLASQAQALNGLGVVQLQLGRDSAGAHHLHQALRLFRQLGHRTGEAWTLNNIGRFHAVRARPDLATRHYRQALEVARDAADRVSQAWALNGLGEVAHAVGRYAQALGHHAAAITADGSGMDQQARAYTGLGHARRALGDFEAARRHYEIALAHYATLGIPAASDLRTCLAGLTQKVPH